MTDNNTLKIFSGNSNPLLVDEIVKFLNPTQRGKIQLKTFPSGEKWCQYEENIRGCDVFLVQSLAKPVNDNLMELLIMCDAARRASAGRISVVLPVFGYARQDRKDKSRVPISARLIMDLFQASGVNRILTMDLHSPQIAGFSNLPVDHLTFRPSLIKQIKDLGIIDAVVSPDIGGVKRADEYATALKTELVIISKKRSNETTVSVKQFVGDVKNKKVMIVDDLTESAGTLIEAAISCKEEGAKEIYCAISHGCFTDVGYYRLINKAFKNNLITKLFVSNSVNFEYGSQLLHDGYEDRIVIVNVAFWFAEAIRNIHENKSVSELFV